MEDTAKKKLIVKRNKTKLTRDTSRVITRAHIPDNPDKISRITDRVLKMTENDAENLLQNVNINFSDRHKNIENIFINNFDKVSQFINTRQKLSHTKEILIGAYFTMEYSVESAALFNPSIVPHPDQTGVEPGNLRFIMSLRATGEGHISSIVFRTGIILKNCRVIFDTLGEYVETPKIRHDKFYDRHLFHLKLKDMNVWNEVSADLFNKLPEAFSFDELKKCITELHLNHENYINNEAIKKILWLADSNYFIKFEAENEISEHVIFPVSDSESRGIEDARFVQFFDDNGGNYLLCNLYCLQRSKYSSAFIDD